LLFLHINFQLLKKHLDGNRYKQVHWIKFILEYLKVIILFKTNKKINKIFNNSNNYQTVNKVKKNDK
jgi:hypothetical protein